MRQLSTDSLPLGCFQRALGIWVWGAGRGCLTCGCRGANPEKLSWSTTDATT